MTIDARLRNAVAALAAATALCVAGCDDAAVPTATTGTLTGLVTRPGDRPDEKNLYLHVAGCEFWTTNWGAGTKPRDESWWVNDDAARTVPNVFVWAVDGPHRARTFAGQTLPTASVEIDHHYFVPHVIGVVRNQEVAILNRDASRFEADVPMGSASPPRPLVLESERTTRFSFPEVQEHVEIVPKRHDWLRLWVFVLDHPFHAASDGAGRFTIPDLEPGTYRFRVWHERFGESEFTAEIVAGRTTEHDVTISAE